MKYEAMECWVDSCDVPASAGLRVVRRSSPWCGYSGEAKEFMEYSDEEVGECWEFLRCLRPNQSKCVTKLSRLLLSGRPFLRHDPVVRSRKGKRYIP